MPRSRVLKDDAIYEIAGDQPADAAALANLRSLSKGIERSRLGEDISRSCARRKPCRATAAAGAEAESDPGRHACCRRSLKVLLKYVAEKNGVAAKVLATVDDLEAIALDDDADVPALKGWRRQFFETWREAEAWRAALALTFDGKRVVVREVEPQMANGVKARK